MDNINEITQNFIENYKQLREATKLEPNAPTLSVDEIVSRLGFFYERIRSIVDWHEEHLIRKVAIEKKLKRRFATQKNKENIAELLILELIRGGYFENHKIKESKVAEVQEAINKYLYLMQNSPKIPARKRLIEWLLDLAACEIEEILDPPIKQISLLDYAFQSMSERIELSQSAIEKYQLTNEEKNTLIYIACQKSLLKFDEPLIAYHLFKLQYPNWKELGENQNYVAKNIYSIKKNIEKEFNHPAMSQFYEICKKYNAAYLVLGDVITDDQIQADKLLQNPEEFEKAIAAAYDKREKIVKKRVKRAAFYATLSIFLSKVLIVLALEIPLDKYFEGGFSYSSLLINVITPPILMLLLILTIKSPGEENKRQVVLEALRMSYRREELKHYSIKAPKKKGFLTSFFLYLIYLLTFLISFGIIISILQNLKFSIFSEGVFIFFICLIAFAGVKIRDRATELEITKKKETALNLIIDLLSLPIIKMGRWLSKQLSKYNAIVIFFNVLIDTPFQAFLEFLEKWRDFIKEKKSENI